MGDWTTSFNKIKKALFPVGGLHWWSVPPPPKLNITPPKKWCLEDKPASFWDCICSGANCYQWSFLVPLIGGRYHIIPQLAVYTTYIPLIYCHGVIMYHLPPISYWCYTSGGYPLNSPSKLPHWWRSPAEKIQPITTFSPSTFPGPMWRFAGPPQKKTQRRVADTFPIVNC